MPGKPLEQMRSEYFALTTDKDRASPYNIDELERLLVNRV